jgi:hypothetical protein
MVRVDADRIVTVMQSIKPFWDSTAQKHVGYSVSVLKPISNPNLPIASTVLSPFPNPATVRLFNLREESLFVEIAEILPVKC